ncbi:hypothetical protein CesoFtcFv8_015533 [Champsocephalus esox]|uniref:Uncharacterized protein n=1 Tax=Champsocephalus esox TaxID=159716 RepID=A0AAN8GSZ6_9TELE|nr:hypothetical protein CesoFtcFv8_015533 [Champsocephalus esox]
MSVMCHEEKPLRSSLGTFYEEEASSVWVACVLLSRLERKLFDQWEDVENPQALLPGESRDFHTSSSREPITRPPLGNQSHVLLSGTNHTLLSF